ncbi:hypothetical protein [Halobacteriovorax sp. HLS]|uniref:hypothetical protein n=1 Tax=Halobacteriovorax sp. HLS TaxID=2234000 RepID=UPI000FDC2873|nr:hypothetical protein [Halobacteriovorax sp. HLS]
MKKIILFLLLCLGSYANASFDGLYYCKEDKREFHLSLELSESSTPAATLEILAKDKMLRLVDVILFDYKESESFFIKIYRNNELLISRFTLSNDNLLITEDNGENDTTICKRVITREQESSRN